jgi:hypothetical protein
MKRLDEYNKTYYRQAVALAKKGIDFVLSPGDLVLLRQRRIGKMLSKVEAVCQFLKYNGADCLTARIASLGTNGREFNVNVEELIPYV